MSTQRTSQNKNNGILPGRGRLPKNSDTSTRRLGLKDKNESRKRIVGIRMTPAQEKTLREFFDEHGKGKGQSFGIFTANLLMEALTAQDAGVSIITTGLPGNDLSKVEEQLQALVQYQLKSMTSSAATSSVVLELAQAFSGLVEQVNVLSQQLAAMQQSVQELHRIQLNTRTTKGSDQFTEKLR